MFSATPFWSCRTGQASVAEVISGGKYYCQCFSKTLSPAVSKWGMQGGNNKEERKVWVKNWRGLSCATILCILPSFSFLLRIHRHSSLFVQPPRGALFLETGSLLRDKWRPHVKQYDHITPIAGLRMRLGLQAELQQRVNTHFWFSWFWETHNFASFIG